MNFKKNLLTIIFACFVFVLVLVLVAVFVLPNKNNAQDTYTSSENVASQSVLKMSVNELVSVCDTVISGKVIKADVSPDGVLYTLQIKTVFKGRNYTSMGYAYLKGKQTLKIANNYLFFGATGDEKYHYYEPFENAPWVYEISDEVVTKHCSNGDKVVVNGIIGTTTENIKDICKN